MKLSLCIVISVFLVLPAFAGDIFDSPLRDQIIKNKTIIKCYDYFIEISQNNGMSYMKVKTTNDFSNAGYMTEGPVTIQMNSEYGGFITYLFGNYSIRYSVGNKRFDLFKTPFSEYTHCEIK